LGKYSVTKQPAETFTTCAAGEAPSISQRLAAWLCDAEVTIPDDVREATRMRILDTLGLALAGRTFDIGAAVLAAVTGDADSGAATIVGGPSGLPTETAALATGSLAEAIEFDDSHNETIVHPSSPVVAAALAAAEARGLTGAELLWAVSLGNEIVCRVATGSPGTFHPRGFHPTGIFAVFGAATAGVLLGRPDANSLVQAFGIAGSFAAGLLESWSDGSWGKLINPGWAAHSGLWAARLAMQGFTGPRTVFEGKAGLFATHLQSPKDRPTLERIDDGLGVHWESRAIAFKLYPNAHVMHGVLDAVREVLSCEAIDCAAIESIECLVAPYMVNLVCEPEAEKRRPPTAAQARISLHHSVAEFLRFGKLDIGSYSDVALHDPKVQRLADRVSYRVMPEWTGRQAFPGGVRIRFRDGRVIERIETANRGSPQRPVSPSDVEEKFRTNAGTVLASDRIETVLDSIRNLERVTKISRLLELCLVPDAPASRR
jgi:2-methylcitrate dehydratase PrpD